MKAEAMRAKSADELKEMVMELRKEQMTLRFQKSGQQVEKTHTLGAVRRDIARAKTIMNEQKLGITGKKPAKAKAAKPAKAEAAPAAEKKAPAAKAKKPSAKKA
ncbi:MAG: 50S ribosomal protein L29 [Alphaproteobacteria bacterium]|nr:50S ribosomal protein L29 [Alphaproteobacteria bacterium]